MILLKFYLVLIVTVAVTKATPEENGARDVSVSYQFFSVKYNPGANEIENEDEVCKREILSNITKELKLYMDTSVDPCDNFYTYACGNFERVHPIPAERTMFNVDAVLSDRLERISKEFFDDVANDTSDVNTAEYKAKEIYKLCVDMDTRRERGIQPLLDFLKTTLGGWHVLNHTFKEDKFDWIEMSGKSHRYLIPLLLTVLVGPDSEEPEKNVIVIHEDNTPIPLPRQDMLSNSSKLEVVKKFIAYVLVLTGVPAELASETSEDIVQFSIEIEKISMDINEVKDFKEYYERLTLRELQNKIPDIDWARLFKSIFGRKISSNQIINIMSTEYVKQLPQLLARTSKKTLANYVFWKYLKMSTNFLDGRYDEFIQTMASILFGTKAKKDPKQECLDLASGMVSEPIESIFVRKYFKRNSKEEVTEMTENFRKTLRKMIAEKDWLDDDTKKEVILKLNNMIFQMGYPDEILSDKAMNQKYKKLKLTPGKYFESIFAVVKFLASEMLKDLNKKRDRNEWSMNTLVVNAYYSRADNKIIIPAGHLIPPYYHVDFPKAINFGAVGMVLGHELTHAFDKNGRNYDSEGKLHNSWSNASAEAFEELTECFVDQYNQYSLHNTSIRGRATVGENIADTSGIRLAYHAYMDWLDETSPREELTLPALDMTDRQLFFLAFAHTWCTASRQESLIRHMKSGVHSPAEFRIRGSLSNMVEFSEAFKCPVGSSMNPEKKCVVW